MAGECSRNFCDPSGVDDALDDEMMMRRSPEEVDSPPEDRQKVDDALTSE